MHPDTRKQLIEIAALVVTQVGFYFGLKYLMANMDPAKRKRKSVEQQSSKILGRLGVEQLVLSDYEQIILSEVILPEDINVNFCQIGGLDHIVDDLRETVIYPLNMPQLFTSASGLLGAPKGILLYGPPGCGKTMTAKALAKESGATFINLHMSTLLDKWFGESNRLVNAVFSLAQKLEPTIIFIDEIDSFLRDRKSSDHEVTSMMKAEFMSLWDGLTTQEGSRVLIMGATNRPLDIDSAILRRMPKRFYLQPPNARQRQQILGLMLREISLDTAFDMDALVKQTDGYSGSDLKELCRNAAMVPIREHMRLLTKQGGLSSISHKDAEAFKLRPLMLSDFAPVEHPANSQETVFE